MNVLYLFQNFRGMSQYLKKIHIEGYKSIKEMDLELNQRINILIGANGSGKSNFVSVFKFLRQIVEKRLQSTMLEVRDVNQFLYYGIKETQAIKIQLDFNLNNYFINLKPSGEFSLSVQSECTAFHNKEKYPEPVWTETTRDSSESRLEEAGKKAGISKYVFEALSSWRVYHFHDTSSNALVKRLGEINDNLFLREDASNLAAFLYRMKIEKLKHFERIVETIKLVVPMFKDFLLRPVVGNEDKIRLEWYANSSDVPFKANQLSDGSLRFICLASALLQPERPGIILLDEPELGLHPSAVKILGGLIHTISYHSQIIVSTQSRELVAVFDEPDEVEFIIVVENKERTSTFKKLDKIALENWLDEYTLVQLWDKNIIGG